MATVHDVAAYILEKNGPMSAMKLQKLVYYSQAWHLVWEDEPLFPQRIEAWANGPVCPDLYDAHRGQFSVSSISGKPERLKKDEKSSINAVLKFYGGKDAQYLSDLTHAEDPWRKARASAGVDERDRCNAVVTPESMMEYYSSLK